MKAYNIDRLMYHAPNSEQRNLHEVINKISQQYARALDQLLPDGAEKTVTMRQLELLRMYANACVHTATRPMWVDTPHVDNVPHL